MSDIDIHVLPGRYDLYILGAYAASAAAFAWMILDTWLRARAAKVALARAEAALEP